ncbi:type II toxin-antitoxin system RelE/ParE family toxin [Aggregatibacter actinomycetemcomitans]|uniref:type II toxin-antitoxin system RelE/ParE family toxin n=1 Tax=Aggregatibacter actinomycetemcomitans TaxID=714 RepID=UPI0011DB6756|nr:type II toxin-antitoxin system RelE/ParE family toxin [Aggregatibacter actinomycetemcomitans]QEH45884.1 type II toxin-antitoxin system RelE/ParE family toxin [Aggregatibacter actinomycetemcomitans]QEH47218.1 type II toxin-antitoxin system RelE/ParE family toxin [Aggregatibacter actinomycetemcomitans]QEH49965.1 type II toxin-antitoxin system RelE/ParE family toxin [Aggregatibacter actinomycetemcomitans]TYA49311.1 type II toxin-antitoxin system RelE/ParE family toxin [Aggregatibacter actinomyc
MWNLIFYETQSRRCPIAEFINGLSAKLQAKALHDLNLLQEFGNQLSMPYSKAMGNGIFELRITQSTNSARIFYFFTQGENIILTNGFIKKTQKTPKNELASALKYKQDYQSRNSS